MNNWNRRKRELFIPDKDTPKTYECKVCGSKIVPRNSERYLVRERIAQGGLCTAMPGRYSEPELFDAFDCKVCGCQMVAKSRLWAVNQTIDKKPED